MTAADLPALEQRLEACLIELERLHQVRPSLPPADMLSPAVTLQDATVKLRRLSVYLLEAQEPARLLASALGAVEKAVEQP